MLLLERDPLVLAEHSREGSLSDRLAASGSQGGLCSPAVPAGELRPSALPLHVPRRATLLLWVAVVALSHFDRGVVTAAALDIAAGDGEAHLSYGYVVALLAWHSIGLALGGLVAGAAFQQVSAKAVLLLSMLVNAASLLVLSLQADASLAVTAVLRAASGLAASFPLVYLPLWVDEFSPSEATGQWMAIVQTGVPVGQTLGVVVAGIATATYGTSDGLLWRGALLVQAVALVPVTLRVLLIPAAQVDVTNISPLRARLDSLTLFPSEGAQGHFGGFIRETREMLQGVSRNPLNTSLTSTLCLLQFTAATLALWAAPYLALSGGAPSPLVTLFVVALLLVLVPALGTYAGALLCNRLDGFKAGHHAAALRVACAFVALAALTGPIKGSTTSFAARLLLIAFWLFCAGAFLPISTGVLMTSMPSYLRSFSSASSYLMYHLVSFSTAQGIMAGLMGCFERLPEALSVGMGLALWATAPAAGLLVLAYAREPKGVVAGGLSGVDDLTFSDISYELSRRRMSTSPL